MAKRHTGLTVVEADASVGRITLLTQTIVATFAKFDIILLPHDVKVTTDALTFLFTLSSATRMHVVRTFHADLQYALAREDIEIIAPIPNKQLIGVVVYMNVAKEIFDIPEPEGVPSPWMQSQEDDLFEDARRIVVEAGKASASYLQRALRIGYSRAARLIDMLEERGVIGPANGTEPREVYRERDEEEDDDDAR